MAIPVTFLKREVIEIPFGKHEAVLSPELDQVCVDGEPYKSAGPSFTPGVVRSGYELAKRQGLLPAICFHNLKYRPAERVTAIRCSPHAGLDESSVWLPTSAIDPPAPGLPHDDFRRAHDKFRGMHHDYRRPHDHVVMMFISRVPAPPAVGDKASGGGEEGGNGD